MADGSSKGMLSQIQDDIGRALDRLKQRDELIGRLLMGGSSSSSEAAGGGEHSSSADGDDRHVNDDIHESVALESRNWNESPSSSSVSPLMACDSSIVLEYSTFGRPMSSPGRISSLMMTHPPSTLLDNDDASIRTSNPNIRYQTSSNYDQKKTEEESCSSNSRSTLVEKYRHFLIRHKSSLGIFERLMENFEYYILFRYDNGLNTEIYYTLWNIIRWMNDIVLYGWGEGMGTLLGTRNELLLLGRSKTTTGKDDDGIISSRRIDLIVRMLRAVLTATSCIHPALDAWCYHSVRFHRHYHGIQHASSYDKIFLERLGGKARAAYVSYKLERIKFLARMALVAISLWTQRQQRKILSNNNENNDTIMHGKSNMNCNSSSSTLIFPMLRGGGELDPTEHVTSLKDMEDEMKVTSYVGKRTGRRSVARNCTSAQDAFSCQPLTALPLLDCLMKFMTSENNRILYVHAVGELLHILRPLYWSRENSKLQSSATSSTMILSHHQQSYLIWKAWFVSLLMDLISDKLLHTNRISTDCTLTGHVAREENKKSQTFMCPTSIDQTKLEQLEMRRRRHQLYLLRSPVYDTITQPLAIVVGKIVSSVPSFGLGRWASEYVLDMMNYWSENHYMLET